MSDKEILSMARQVFDNEINGIYAVRDALDDSFTKLVQWCLETLENGGKIVLSGLGKSGHVGHKIAATLASTGSQAVFLHPVEAVHGDLGVLGSQDLLVLLSYSGETDELLEVVPAAKRFNIRVVCVTGVTDSRLVQWTDLTVPMEVPEEACPFNMAPTTSTTALLVLGDALAMVLLRARDLSRSEYAKLHPSGAIGRSMVLGITDVMRRGERFPRAPYELPVHEALSKMTQARAGSIAVVGTNDQLQGVFTDGDFRRCVMEDPDVLTRKVGEVATTDPITISADAMAIELLQILEQKNIDDVIVVNNQGQAVGLVDSQDLPSFKLM